VTIFARDMREARRLLEAVSAPISGVRVDSTEGPEEIEIRDG
jgi:hypothetical protein